MRHAQAHVLLEEQIYGYLRFETSVKGIMHGRAGRRKKEGSASEPMLRPDGKFGRLLGCLELSGAGGLVLGLKGWCSKVQAPLPSSNTLDAQKRSADFYDCDKILGIFSYHLTCAN